MGTGVPWIIDGIPGLLFKYITDTVGVNHKALSPYIHRDGFYYITQDGFELLKKEILYLEDLIKKINVRCDGCGCRYNSITGHAFNETIVACAVCYATFANWRANRLKSLAK